MSISTYGRNIPYEEVLYPPYPPLLSVIRHCIQVSSLVNALHSGVVAVMTLQTLVFFENRINICFFDRKYKFGAISTITEVRHMCSPMGCSGAEKPLYDYSDPTILKIG